ncbi:MAG: hypothetical protein HQ522_15410 [Bacteroidetes bacterium]|nr:hypothetical protein [Bacteroidota bacterium]
MKNQNTCILICLLSLTFLFFSLTGTQPDNSFGKEKYRTEGEREKSSIKKYFKKNYKPQFHTKYSGRISFDILPDQVVINYDNSAMRLNIADKQYLEIFTSGLLSEQMLGGSTADTVSICCIEELTYVKTKKHHRRFKLLVFRNWYLNPNVFLIELTNIQSDRKSDLKTFLNGAELTFLVNPWNQI